MAGMTIGQFCSRLVAASLALFALAACKGGSDSNGDGPHADLVAENVPRIERATGLKFKTPPRIEVRSRDQIREFLQSRVTEEAATKELLGQQSAYRRLALLPETLDLRSFLVNLLTEQVAGYYDPKTKVLYVPDDARAEILEQTVTHELVHALQDQYANLDSIQGTTGQNDRVTAASSVMEGQATFVSLRLMGGQLIAWDKAREVIRQSQSSMPLFSTAPTIIQETLLFPYLSGAEFMSRYDTRNPRSSPFSGNLPVSTEQILHADAYFDKRDDPVRITLPSPTTGETTYENNLGEFETRILLFEHTRDQNLAVRAAAGWDGDRYMVIRTARGEGIAWLTIWDSAIDAAEFTNAMSEGIAVRFKSPAGDPLPSGGKKYVARERALMLWGGEVSGRSAVLFVDVPDGVDTNVIDVAKVELR
ncbi:MAG: hypothetical protein H7Z74_14115 [Anaerolineae bacterium]|nr:hypothetical protein [Gemmatimonadaceae bacterium]